MGQQTLQTIISISGRVDNSFGRIGDMLMNVGNHIDALSQKMIDFGKDSVQEYVQYDDVMREVQALGEYDDKTMRILNEYNKTIAQSSRYTMDQAAQAEVMMAQLGLNMDQTQTLMPTVMSLATAANIDLADSLDYLYYTLNALGMPMEYANTLSDQMSKTAAISAADIDTLGQSMQRLGSGAQFFAGGSSEILAILGGISQFGEDMQGRDAGTQLRNFMLTLLAPTQSKDKLIQSLRVTEEEWAEFEAYMEDAGIDVANTADAMNELGLSVYDSTTGELKPAIQIIGELAASLSTLSEADKNEMLGNLFGKRTTTTALNLMEALGTIIAYKEQIESGSAGYTESMAGTIEGGLGGALRAFTAARSAFQATIGEAVAPEAEATARWLTDLVNAISGMDGTALNALTGAAEGIAVAGPGLMVSAGAFRLIGFALTPVGRWAAGLTLAAAAVGALKKGIAAWKEETLEAHFGDMELDDTALLAHVNGIGDAFNDAYAEINSYNAALQTAVESFETASSTLSGELLTSMITGSTLTPEQTERLAALGETMGDELLAGISASFDKSASYLTMLFGGLDTAAYDDEYAGAILLADTMYENLVGQAEQLGREFGETLGAAMDDGVITGNEYSAIMEKMQAYNDAMALAAQADQAAELAKQLHKAQSVSWDSAESFLAEQAAIMNANLADAEMTHIGETAKWGVYYDEAIRQGWINPLTGAAYSEADKAAFLSDMDAQYAARIQGYKDDNAQVTMAVLDALIGQSDFGEALPFLRAALGDIGTMERNSLTGALTLEDVDWAGLDAAGLLTDDIAGQLFDFHSASGELRKLFEPYADNPEVATLLEQMGYLYALGQEAQFYQMRKADFEATGYDPLGEFGAYGTGKAASEAVPAQAAAGEAAAQALMEGYGTPELGATIDSTGISQDASNTGSAARESLYAGWGDPVLSATVRTVTSGGGLYNKLTKYAGGGRASEASIFGEAGPEWAIPEEHTDRVASLFNAAREAAGFTWPELVMRNGGLNAGGGTPAQIIYSPTIIAADANGVEQKLLEDKERLDGWWKEKQMRDDVEVYA